MFKKSFIVGMGGSLGALLRYLVGSLFPTIAFPLSTLTINIIGCFLLGGITSLAGRNKLSEKFTLLLGTGFCGGFTTISTFSFESFTLFHDSPILSYLYMLSSGILAVGAGLLGIIVGRSKGRRL
ncbi:MULTISPECIES: fluoride efflux transporter CrcB [Bacillus]|uniref:fluoride efflux transporter CrcB n=1 Tax=Bacillus TaxID=1386 RepID=UPI0002F5A4BC|nr:MULTISPECIES: fluoride efflux transporter CrcB [Bacillus]